MKAFHHPRRTPTLVPHFVAPLCLLLAAVPPINASAQPAAGANIVIMTVEDPNNYEAPRTMREFADKDLRPLGHHVTIVEGDKPATNLFEGLTEALKEADLLVLFVRRRTPLKEQLDGVRDHLAAGKPLLGIRTANHAFAPKTKEVVQDPKLSAWPDFTIEVLGGQNAGYETKGLPYTVTASPGTEKDPLLEGVQSGKILGYQSLYKVLPLAADARPLLEGSTKGNPSAQPIAWTRFYGPKQARIFYTSLGAPEDMAQPDVRQLLRNAVAWTLGK